MNDNDFLYGKNSVELALQSEGRSFNKLFILKDIKFDNKVKNIQKLARENSIPVSLVPKEKLNKLTEKNHQGVVLFVSPVEYTDLHDFLEDTKDKKDKMVIALDGVEDPHNVGAIIRTAVCAGADAIVLTKRRCANVNATVEKTSAGAVGLIPIIQVNNLADALRKLKENDYWVVSAEASAKQNYFDLKYDMNSVFVLGGENKGISNIVKKLTDFYVKIPMLGKFNSLNVSNAASILMFEVVRQKLKK